MKLSNNFELDELIQSDTAVRKSINEQFHPNSEIVENLKDLCANILEPIEQNVDRKIIVSSGYRCIRLNKIIGGAINSQHTEGKAADIVISGMTTAQIILLIKELKIEFDQVIEEFGRWVHVSYNKGKNRNQIFRAVKKGSKTVYLPY